MKLSVVFVLLGAFGLCFGKKILFVVPMPSKSHFILSERLVEKLAEKGHQVTVIAPFKRSKPLPKVNDILIPDISSTLFKEKIGNASDGRFQLRNMNPLQFFTSSGVGETMMEQVMNHKQVKDLVNSDQKFDLLVGECFLMEGLLMGLAHRFNIPIVMISPSVPFTYLNIMVGNPAPPAYISDTMLGYSGTMNFFQRLSNFVFTTLSQVLFHIVHIPRQNSMMKKYFGADSPPLQEMIYNISLVLINHHFSLGHSRPYVPNMVEIGGYHVKPPKPLPKDLQNFIDTARDGVIYFSMGSNLQSSEFPEDKFVGILRAFSRLKQRVLWKFEKENPPNLPKNVKISKWLPQSDILAHPNVKLFITHGGLLSTTESILRGVPLIGIPIFGDQPMNVKHIEKMGVGVRLGYEDISEKSMFDSIQEVLNNAKYTDNVKFRSRALQDRPLPPIDAAVYWLEYVMRYKGAFHLRSGALNLAWYQFHMLDVYAFFALVLFVFVFVLLKLFCWIWRSLQGKKKVLKSKKKKN